MKQDIEIKNIKLEIQLKLQGIPEKGLKLKISYKESIETFYKELFYINQFQQINNQWIASYFVTYNFMKYQSYRIDVVNDEQGSKGSIQFDLGEVVKNKMIIRTSNYFQITINAILLQNGNCFQWQWAGEKLLNTDGIFNKSDPFLLFYIWDNDQWNQVYQTEYIDDNLNPIWQPFEIDMGLLNYYDETKPFKIECWDNSKKNPPKHKYIGELEITYQEIQTSSNKIFPLKNPEKKKCGFLKLISCNIIKKNTFLGLLQEIQIQTLMIFEYTKSSIQLHSSNPGTLNLFSQMLTYIGSVLMQYNQENTLQLLGLGCITQNQQKDFISISKGQNCIQNICADYSKSLKEIKFGDKIIICPILFEIIKQTEIFKPNFTLSILVIENSIQDYDQFTQFLNHKISLPILIIIIQINETLTQSLEFIDKGECNLNQIKIIHIKEFTQEMIKYVRSTILSYLMNELIKMIK